MTYDPDILSVAYVDYPPKGEPRGWYIVADCYEEIHEGPFSTMSAAEKALHDYAANREPDHDWTIWANAATPFADNH